MIEWDKLKAMPEAKKTSGVRWDELKAMPDVSAIEWDELKRLREKPVYANAIRRANERIAESAKKSGSEYKIGLDETWDMDYDGKSTEELLYELACEKYGVPHDSESYLKRAGKQVLLGNYTDDVTALGTAGQMLLGLTGLDAPADVRDLTYDLSNWDWSWSHVGQTALDALSLLPGVGAIKYVDEAGEVLQNGLKRLDEARELPEVTFEAARAANSRPYKGGGAPTRHIGTGLDSVNAPEDILNIADKPTAGAGNVGKKTIVIGETMSRVTKYAESISAEVYGTFKYYEKTKALFGEKLADFIGGVDNALWLIDKMVHKYKIVDLGLDVERATRSPYYLMESVLSYLYKYKDYAEDFMKGAF